MQTYQLIATAAAGIEALVGKELRDLGYEVKVENGRVRFQGTMKDVIRTNLWLRTADRVKIVVGEFDARSLKNCLIVLKTSHGKICYQLMRISQ